MSAITTLIGYFIGTVAGAIIVNSLFNKSCLGIVGGVGILVAWIALVVFVL